MRPDLAPFVPPALAALGGGLQFLRASRRFSDWFVMPLAATLSVAVWCLAADWSKLTPDAQMFLLKGIAEASGCVASCWGGIFGAAKLANGSKDAGSSLDPGHALIPATDSKS